MIGLDAKNSAMNTWKRVMRVIDRHRGRNALRQDVTSFNASQVITRISCSSELRLRGKDQAAGRAMKTVASSRRRGVGDTQAAYFNFRPRRGNSRKSETKLHYDYTINSHKALYVIRMSLLNRITHLQGRSLRGNNPRLTLAKLTSSPFTVIDVVSSFIASRACFSQMARDYRARSFLEYRTGSWSELDGPKTLNTETCRTTAVADRLLDTAVIYTGTVYMRVVYTPADYMVADCTEGDPSSYPPRLFYAGNLLSRKRAFMVFAKPDVTKFPRCYFAQFSAVAAPPVRLAFYVVIIVARRATPYWQPPVSSPTSAFSNAVLSVKGGCMVHRSVEGYRTSFASRAKFGTMPKLNMTPVLDSSFLPMLLLLRLSTGAMVLLSTDDRLLQNFIAVAQNGNLKPERFLRDFSGEAGDVSHLEVDAIGSSGSFRDE
ncbi:hypothetical protein DBV15_01662 [Temnothorax longispinosus]|uniref:Uncharacterized protein n=1 Tax=Temnothorax longispinosus TaxID=300112 RepID=A0A4V3SCB4_9HYME|nr:hypothetical protein DBV15_01662 [Temnothorax longispinosus]